jgi:transcription initiation factor TFIID subunit 4
VIQAESDELRRQDANKTALAAIGPRKKRKLDEASGAGGSLGGGGGSGLLGSSQALSQAVLHSRSTVFRPKIKRVSLKDLIFLMEQEKEFRRSPLLYKALNK